MVESWTKNLLSTVVVSSVINIKEDGAMKVPISRTDLNGGEREQERDRQAKRQKEEVKDQPRTNLNGGKLGQSTLLVLTFAFTLAFNPLWMDEEVASADIPKQWQEARANRQMQFKVGNYRDGSGKSNIRLLTGTIKADWIQLPVEQYLAALTTLKQSVIAGVFRQKGATPWNYQRGEVATFSLSNCP